MEKRFARAEQGSALVSVMVPLLGILVLGYAFFHATLAEQRNGDEDLDQRRALSLAEAGLHEAFQSVRMHNSGNVGTADKPAYLGGGVVWVAATDIGSDQRQLVSTAMVGSGRCALEAVIHMQPEKPPLFVATLNSKETLTCNADVMIDSFDSADGTYAAQATGYDHGYTHAGMNGDVRSNQDVILNARATIFGDAIPGPGHGVSFATDAWVSGDVVPATEPFVFPSIDYPGIASTGDFSLAAAATKTLAPGNYGFNNFTINKDAKLKIVGPATIELQGNFTGGKTAQLNIDATNGPVTFYVHGNYSHISGFAANAVGSSPMALGFMVEGAADVVFPMSTKVRGAYYAPNARILFASGCECFGAFAANRIEMSNAMHFHFDETLMSHWQGESGSDGDPLSLVAWRETAVVPSSLVADRRDPLLVLDVKASDLPSPGAAWEK